MKYKIIIAYDGTDYQGWQKQKDGSTIAGIMQKIFFKVFNEEISLFGASRTDAGVHANGQVATFKTSHLIPINKMLSAWNNKLPASIIIKSIETVSDTYNPHHHIIEKTYEYTFSLERPAPCVARYQWYYRWPINLAKLKEATKIFVGTHNFRSFCTGNDLKDTVRTITHISLRHIENQTYTITFKGPGFLRYMIRRIVGAFLEVASRPNLPISYLKKILESGWEIDMF